VFAGELTVIEEAVPLASGKPISPAKKILFG
jgi:hypothetical protein